MPQEPLRGGSWRISKLYALSLRVSLLLIFQQTQSSIDFPDIAICGVPVLTLRQTQPFPVLRFFRRGPVPERFQQFLVTTHAAHILRRTAPSPSRHIRGSVLRVTPSKVSLWVQ